MDGGEYIVDAGVLIRCIDKSPRAAALVGIQEARARGLESIVVYETAPDAPRLFSHLPVLRLYLVKHGTSTLEWLAGAGGAK